MNVIQQLEREELARLARTKGTTDFRPATR